MEVLKGTPTEVWQKTKTYSGIKKEWYDQYFEGRATAYAIRIKNLVIYNEPKELPFHAPQSYRYIEILKFQVRSFQEMKIEFIDSNQVIYQAVKKLVRKYAATLIYAGWRF